MKAPGTKIQAPEKFQTPKLKRDLEFGIWSLEIGAS
jgi:hypothetical protein